jgi:hypothetical protein
MSFTMKQLKNNRIKIEKAEPDQAEYAYTGGKINTRTLKSMISNGYTKNPKAQNNIDGYILDPELSGTRSQVYYNPETDHLVVNTRGTKGVQDWITDARLMMNDKSSNRFKHSKKVIDDAIRKYPTDNTTLTGHSLGSKLTQEANKQHNAEEILVNPAVTPYDMFDKQKQNSTVVRSSLDPISALHSLSPFKTKERTITIKPESYNLMKEHKSSVLDRLPEEEIGV